MYLAEFFEKTKFCPINGIAVNKLVITVAPQKLIWPHGKTYPINAVAIDKIKIKIPEFQTWVLGYLYDL